MAFTLIELLIVIAIIGILFIVLVSKVDFATDKAKATGVQTTFRSYLQENRKNRRTILPALTT